MAMFAFVLLSYFLVTGGKVLGFSFVWIESGFFFSLIEFEGRGEGGDEKEGSGPLGCW